MYVFLVVYLDPVIVDYIRSNVSFNFRAEVYHIISEIFK